MNGEATIPESSVKQTSQTLTVETKLRSTPASPEKKHRSSLRDSLTSSRPAPPSPSPSSSSRSRPSSGLLSKRSSRGSGKETKRGSSGFNQKRASRLQNEIQLQPTDDSAQGTGEIKQQDDSTPGREPPSIKIRDFAFSAPDPRHIGRGPNVPDANNYLLPPTTPRNDDEDEEYSSDGDYDYDGPTTLPGSYRALYTFEPEGSSEMALTEGQIVTVIGDGGDGWAIVLRAEEEGGGHALVPEGYLDPIAAGEDEQ